MTLVEHHIAALILTSITNLGVGLLVFLADTKKRMNQVFGLYSLTILWWSAAEALVVSAKDQSTAGFWSFIMWPGVIFIAPTFLHTVFLSIGEKRRTTLTLRFAYLAGGLFLVLHLFTDLVTASPRPVGYAPFHNRLTAFGSILPLFFLIVVNIALWSLWRSYRITNPPQKTRLKYLFWASVIGYLGGSPDWFFALGFHIPLISPFGLYGVSCYSLATAYAVLHHKLFDVNLVIRKSLVYSFLVTTLSVGYFGLIFIVERLFQVSVGYSSPVFSVAAFALMALVFQPLRLSIQHLVDRVFFLAPREVLVKRLERLEQEVRQTEKLKAVAIFASGLAHEIKNPLTSLKTFAEYLPEKGKDPIFQSKFQRIVTQEVERIDLIVRRLLDFAKPATPQLRPTSVSRLLDETLDFLTCECLRRGVDVQRSYEADEDTILADPPQLRQAFLNLFLNGLEAMGEGGQLFISTELQDDQLIVIIEDTGPGIPNEHLNHLFEPFFTTKPNGTGLGLSITRAIISDHHGTLTINSRRSRGICCVLAFPVKHQPAKQQAVV